MRNTLSVTWVLALLLTASCDRGRAEERELLRRQVEAMERAERLEAEREAERRRLDEERRRAEAEHQRLDALASAYAYQAGLQLMNAVGGGQDLVTRYGEWRYTPSQRVLTIPVTVAFDGSFIRSNEYFVSGVLTVAEDGSSPKFAREHTNQNYRDAEGRFLALGLTAGGLIILADMVQESGK